MRTQIRTRFPLPLLTVALGSRVRDWFEHLSASCLKSAMQTPSGVTHEDVLAIRQMIEMLEQDNA